MKLNACVADIEEMIGGKLSPAQKKDAVKYLQRAAYFVRKENPGKDLSELSAQLAQKATELIEQDTLAKAQQKLLNRKRELEMKSFVTSNYDDIPEEGIFALFGDISLSRTGAKAGLYASVNAKRTKYMQGALNELHRIGLYDLAHKGVFDEEIVRAKVELNRARLDGRKADLSGIKPEAAKIAQILDDFAEMARKDANDAGSNIGVDENFIFSRSHDQHKIGKAGGNKFGSIEAKNAWIKEMEELGVDYERMFPGLETIDDYRKAMGNIFQSLSHGYHLTFEGAGPRSKGMGSTAKKLTHERVIHFKDAASELKYMKKYGQGETVLHNFITDMSHMARDIAVMEKLGPSGFDNFRGVYEQLREQYHNAGQPEKVVKLTKEFDKLEKWIWPEMAGHNSVPTNTTMAALFGGMRSFLNMGMLGGATLSSISDMASSASVTRFFTDRQARAYGDGIKALLESQFGELKTLFKNGVPEDVRAKAEAFGIILDHVQPAMIGGTDLSGRMQNWSDTYFKLNGLTQWTRAVKMATASVVNNFYAKHIGVEFDKLPAGMREGFIQFGITDKDWDMIRAGELFTDDQQRKYLDIKSITKDNPKVDALPEVVDAKKQLEYAKTEINNKDSSWSDADKAEAIAKLEKDFPKKLEKAREKAVETLQEKYSMMMNEIASMGATEPGTIERGFMFMGTQRGTWLGELTRSVMQFKSFTFRAQRAHMNRELYGYSAQPKTLPQALKDLFVGKDMPAGSRQGPAMLLATGVMLGIVSNYLKDLTKGQYKPVENAKDLAQVVSAGLFRSGGLGFYGDFVFGDHFENQYGRSPLTGALGPMFGFVDDTAKLIGMGQDWMTEADSKFKAAQLIRYGKSYIPGVSTVNNHFLTSYISNKLFFHNLMEWSNPGYLRKYEKTIQDKQGKHFIRTESIDTSPTNRWDIFE